MPTTDLNNDPRLNTLSLLRLPLWVLDTGSMQIIWANDAGIAYWQAVDAAALYTHDLTRQLSKSVIRQIRQSAATAHELNSSLYEMWTFFPSGLAQRSSEFSISPFSLSDNHNAILCEVINKISNADAQALHSATALNNTGTMISLFDVNNQLLYRNLAAHNVQSEDCDNLEKLLINDTDLFVIDDALQSADSCSLELEVATKAGSRWHTMLIRVTQNALTGENALLISAQDTTERRHAQQIAHKLAYTDSLTNLPNRAALSLYLDELLKAGNSETTKFSLFFLDLDRFKIINDSLGHAVGDQLLIEVALRLKRTIGAHGMVCRLGGDEFVSIVNRQTQTDRLRELAQTVLLSMAQPLELAGQNLRILPSIGICRYPEDGETFSELMQHADAAMYMAKSHQSGYCFYDGQMAANVTESIKVRLSMENDLVSALEQQQFELYYQPKISGKQLTVAGVEALIRWNHPTRGLVPPDEFIEIAEETGQIIELGNWVMDSAMKQQRSWHDAGIRIPVAINISARQFVNSDLLMNVSENLLRNRCDPAMIELEITESMLLGSAEDINETLQQLSAMGIKLTLDDFGTGYSNLAYLQKYPLDNLKIDRIFLTDQRYSLLLSTILNMGKVLGLNVVAEGVESASQAGWLTGKGCDQLQGYYFSKPLPVDEITQYLLDNSQAKPGSLHKAA